MPRMKGDKSASSWPEEHVETLKDLWSKQMTAAQIAEQIPFSRSAVLGMARRLKLECRAPTDQVEKFDRCVELVSDHGLTLEEAAKQTRLNITTARQWWEKLVGDYDDRDPVDWKADDERHGLKRPPSSWTPLDQVVVP